MYAHPIKFGGLSMNRILYSNTKMVMKAFPAARDQQFNLSFKYRSFEGGKTTSTKCKCSLRVCTVLLLTVLCLGVLRRLHLRRPGRRAARHQERRHHAVSAHRYADKCGTCALPRRRPGERASLSRVHLYLKPTPYL